MKILITGAGGFVGRHLLQDLSSAGKELLATYRREPPPYLRENSRNVQWIEADLGKTLVKLDPVDIIIHLAAVHYQSRRTPTPVDLIETNIHSTLNLCEYARKCGVKKFIHFSTVTIYGNVQVPLLTEGTPVKNPDFYGATKYLGERLLKEYSTDFPITILRLPAILGPNYFIPWIGRVLLRAFKDEPIDIFDGNKPFNNVTDVQEISRLIRLLIEKTIPGYRIFNVGASNPIPLKEAVNLLVELAKSQSTIREISSIKKSFSIDIHQLTQIIGFEAEKTRILIERYVKSNLVHMKQHRSQGD